MWSLCWRAHLARSLAHLLPPLLLLSWIAPTPAPTPPLPPLPPASQAKRKASNLHLSPAKLYTTSPARASAPAAAAHLELPPHITTADLDRLLSRVGLVSSASSTPPRARPTAEAAAAAAAASPGDAAEGVGRSSLPSASAGWQLFRHDVEESYTDVTPQPNDVETTPDQARPGRASPDPRTQLAGARSPSASPSPSSSTGSAGADEPQRDEPDSLAELAAQAAAAALASPPPQQQATGPFIIITTPTDDDGTSACAADAALLLARGAVSGIISSVVDTQQATLAASPAGGAVRSSSAEPQVSRPPRGEAGRGRTPGAARAGISRPSRRGGSPQQLDFLSTSSGTAFSFELGPMGAGAAQVPARLPGRSLGG